MEGAAMRTAEDLIKWIIENTTGLDEGTFEEQALWFVAYQEGLDLRETSTVKDLAYLFLDGMKPLKDDPRGSIQNWLDEYFEGDVLTEEHLVKMLRTHFGLDE